MSKPEHMHVPEGPQRFDVFTGAGRRRRFSLAEKAAIVEESYGAGTSVCGVARRHGLTSQQLFGWLASDHPAPPCGRCSCPSS